MALEGLRSLLVLLTPFLMYYSGIIETQENRIAHGSQQLIRLNFVVLTLETSLRANLYTSILIFVVAALINAARAAVQ